MQPPAAPPRLVIDEPAAVPGQIVFKSINDPDSYKPANAKSTTRGVDANPRLEDQGSPYIFGKGSFGEGYYHLQVTSRSLHLSHSDSVSRSGTQHSLCCMNCASTVTMNAPRVSECVSTRSCCMPYQLAHAVCRINSLMLHVGINSLMLCVSDSRGSEDHLQPDMQEAYRCRYCKQRGPHSSVSLLSALFPVSLLHESEDQARGTLNARG